MQDGNEPLAKGELLPHALQLQRSIASWEQELSRTDPIRSTLWYGIMVKSSIEVERLLHGCLSAILWIAGPRGHEIVRLSARRPDRPTFGEIVRALKAILPIVAEALGAEPLPHDSDVCRALDTLVRIRNNLVHGGLRRSETSTGGSGTATAQQFLHAVGVACGWDLISAIDRAA